MTIKVVKYVAPISMWRVYMCDIKKFTAIFHEINNLTPDDTLQLILESETDEEKDFYSMIGDYLLQKKQKEAIERNVY